MASYRISYTRDQKRYTPVCGLDSRIPIKSTEDLLRKEADEICGNGSYRFGNGYITVHSQGITTEVENEFTDRIIALIKASWDIVKL